MRHLPHALVLALCASCASPSLVQDATSPDPDPDSGFGAELQIYPAGIVPSVRYERSAGDRTVYFARAGLNLTDRQDFGEHDDETGDGFGAGVGARHWVANERSPDGARLGWHWGGRVDLWRLDIDWEDDAPARTGSTQITVLQPALEGGYSWAAGSGRLDLTLSLGAEINIDTDGDDVGEGAILLVGVSFLP